jgi:hypothetical protein
MVCTSELQHPPQPPASSRNDHARTNVRSRRRIHVVQLRRGRSRDRCIAAGRVEHSGKTQEIAWAGPAATTHARGAPEACCRCIPACLLRAGVVVVSAKQYTHTCTHTAHTHKHIHTHTHTHKHKHTHQCGYTQHIQSRRAQNLRATRRRIGHLHPLLRCHCERDTWGTGVSAACVAAQSISRCALLTASFSNRLVVRGVLASLHLHRIIIILQKPNTISSCNALLIRTHSDFLRVGGGGRTRSLRGRRALRHRLRPSPLLQAKRKHT